MHDDVDFDGLNGDLGLLELWLLHIPVDEGALARRMVAYNHHYYFSLGRYYLSQMGKLPIS